MIRLFSEYSFHKYTTRQCLHCILNLFHKFRCLGITQQILLSYILFYLKSLKILDKSILVKKCKNFDLVNTNMKFFRVKLLSHYIYVKV